MAGPCLDDKQAGDLLLGEWLGEWVLHSLSLGLPRLALQPLRPEDIARDVVVGALLPSLDAKQSLLLVVPPQE